MNDNGFKFGPKAEIHIIKGKHNKIMNPTTANFGIGGTFGITCHNKDGKLKWETKAKNGVTNVGLNSTLDVYFRATDTIGGAAGASWGWGLGIISNSGFTSIAAADTHSSHGGWTEFTTYTVSGNALIRAEWVPDPAASQSVANPTLLEAVITGAGSLYGLFIAGGNINGTTPVAADADNKGSSNAAPLLWAHAAFLAGVQTVSISDTVRVTYTVNASSA